MLNRFNYIGHPGTSRKRGGTYFTMMIFVMMLVSTALMYYYFQRTKELQREIVSLKSGMGLEAEAESGFWDWLPWGKDEGGEDDDTPEPAAAPAVVVQSTPRPVAATPAVMEEAAQTADSELPPPGAASTPRPTNPETGTGNAPILQGLNLNAQNEPAAVQEPQVLEPIDSTEAAETAPSAGESAEGSGAEDGQPGTNAPAEESRPGEPIQSMYDQLPPVRVRSPRQSE